MGNKNKRPIFLNLLRIRLPVTGVVSILHRVSGVLLVLLLPPALLLLDRSLAGPDAFEACRRLMTTLPAKVLWFVALWLFVQHFLNGIRHLLLDLDICIDRECARRSAWLALAGSVLAVVAFGILR